MSRTKILGGDDRFCDLQDGRKICYRLFGPEFGEPIVLIVGLGLQLTYWPPGFVHGLTSLGKRVIVLDNRDVGGSSTIAANPPSLIQKVLRKPPAEAYSIEDMADDVRALLNYLSVPTAHVVGMSMGGMIAQSFAARYPEQTLTLTSIFSTTGARRVGQPSLSSIRMLLGPPAKTRERAIADFVEVNRRVGSTSFVIDEQAIAQYAEDAWRRGSGAKEHEGVSRQLGAIMKSGDRTQSLQRVTASTLVIHGDRDALVATSGGYATAAAISGSTLVLIAGMGHMISESVAPYLVSLIKGHIERSALQKSVSKSHQPSPSTA